MGGKEMGKNCIENFKNKEIGWVVSGWECLYWQKQCSREGEITKRTKSLVRLTEARLSSLPKNLAIFLIY